MTEHQLVFVKWHDAKGVSDTWQFLKDAAEPAPAVMESVGWVIQENDDVIVIAPHMSTDEDSSQYCGEMQIPKVAIL